MPQVSLIDTGFASSFLFCFLLACQRIWILPTITKFPLAQVGMHLAKQDVHAHLVTQDMSMSC